MIVAPTRELSVQIANEAEKFARATGLTTVCLYGGVSREGQINILQRQGEYQYHTLYLFIENHNILYHYHRISSLQLTIKHDFNGTMYNILRRIAFYM